MEQTQTEPAAPSTLFGDFTKLIEQFKLPGIDVNALMEARRKAPSIVPAVYGDATKSPLKETVPPSGTVRLELNSKP